MLLSVILAVTLGHAAGSAAQPENRALERFKHAVADYMKTRRQVERHLPRLEVSPDAWSIQKNVDAMTRALREARPHASRGDIFDSEISEVFRRRIHGVLRQRDCAVSDLAAELSREIPDDGTAPAVNERFSWRAASMTPPCVLAVLPPLPRELHYRFIAGDLVLVDVDADLVVDVLPDLVPVAEGRKQAELDDHNMPWVATAAAADAPPSAFHMARVSWLLRDRR